MRRQLWVLGLGVAVATAGCRATRPDASATALPGPVLVAQGGRDINVKLKTVDAGVAALRAIGVAVTYVRDPDADHFYFFEKRDEFAEQFRAWWPTAIPPAG